MDEQSAPPVEDQDAELPFSLIVYAVVVLGAIFVSGGAFALALGLGLSAIAGTGIAVTLFGCLLTALGYVMGAE